MLPEENGQERSVGEIAQDLGNVASELFDRVDIGRELQEHPYRTLAIAAGIGYVLGGGLFTPLTGSLLRVGMRVAMLPMVTNAMTGMAEATDETEGYL